MSMSVCNLWTRNLLQYIIVIVQVTAGPSSCLFFGRLATTQCESRATIPWHWIALKIWERSPLTRRAGHTNANQLFFHSPTPFLLLPWTESLSISHSIQVWNSFPSSYFSLYSPFVYLSRLLPVRFPSFSLSLLCLCLLLYFSFFLYFAIFAVSIIACVGVYCLPSESSFFLSQSPFTTSSFLSLSRFSLFFYLSSYPSPSPPPPPNSYLSLLWLYNLDESLVAGYGPEGPPDHHLFGQQISYLKDYKSWFSKFLIGAAT